MKSGGMQRYIDDVTNNHIVVCHWVRRAVERHVQDLQFGAARGLRFDEHLAQHAIDFFHRFLHHSKGEWAGQPIRLETWQQFIIGSLFGWIRADDTRRFRVAFIEVGRKNGKSTLGAGVGLYLLSADGEPGAEVYSAATKRDQAKIVWLEAARMARKSPYLNRRFAIFGDRNSKSTTCNISIPHSLSKFEPLGADSDSMDGLNVQGAIVDEIHAHKTRELWDQLRTATGARRQPLLFGITTAGFNRQSLCFQLHDRAEKILDGVLEDDSFFRRHLYARRRGHRHGRRLDRRTQLDQGQSQPGRVQKVGRPAREGSRS